MRVVWMSRFRNVQPYGHLEGAVEHNINKIFKFIKGTRQVYLLKKRELIVLVVSSHPTF